MKRLAAALAVALAASSPPAPAATTTTATPTDDRHADDDRPRRPRRPAELYPDHIAELYAGTDNWICHPELADERVQRHPHDRRRPRRHQTVDELGAGDRPGFDCFYVYPTTSTDPGANSDLELDSSETHTVLTQVARYALGVPGVRAGVPAGDAGRDLRRRPTADVRRDRLRRRPRRLVAPTSTSSARPRRRPHRPLAGRRPPEPAPPRGDRAVGRATGAAHLGRPPRRRVRRRLVAGHPAVRLGRRGRLPHHLRVVPRRLAAGRGLVLRPGPRHGEPAVCVDPVALAGGNGLADAVLPATGGLFRGAEPRRRHDAVRRLPRCASAPSAPSHRPTAATSPCRRRRRPTPGRSTRFFAQLLDPSWGTAPRRRQPRPGRPHRVVTRQAEAHAARD